MLRIFRHFLPAPTLFLGFSEVIVLFFSIYILLFSTHSHSIAAFSLTSPAACLSLIASGVFVLAMVGLGLYSYDVLLDYRMMVVKTFVAFTLAIPIIVTIFVLSRTFNVVDDATWSPSYVKLTLVWLTCLVITRVVFVQIADIAAFKRRLLVLGTGQKAARINQLVESGRNRQFSVVGYHSPRDEPTSLPNHLLLRSPDGAENPILALSEAHSADEIVIAMEDRRGLPVHHLLNCKVQGIGVTEFLSFVERETGRVDLDSLQPSWLILSDGFRATLMTDAVKRVFDVLVSCCFLIVTLPVLLMTAAAIKLEDGGPVFYRQERVGLFGRAFTLSKFRSMRVDAEQDGRPQWAAAADSRCTRVGAIIRKLRIDELPQIFCVLRGHMSFIGPRPERPFFVRELAAAIPFYNERHSVKPGISGWAQINYPYGASLEDARQKLSYDLYYVKNRSVFLDFIILIQTLRVIVWPDGAR